MQKNRHGKDTDEFDEEVHRAPSPTAEALAIAADSRGHLARALESLPSRSREIIVLRELEGCSYKEIAIITSIPIGTVMSTLSPARRELQMALTGPANKESIHDL